MSLEVEPRRANLVSCHLIEKDVNGDLIWVWSYPCFSSDERDVHLKKMKYFFEHGLRQKPFRYFRLNDHWVYAYSSEVFSSDRLPQVKQVTLIVTAGDFNPDRYETLCRVLTKSYCKSGHPVVMLKLFLSVMATGRCTTEENGTFFAEEFDTAYPFRQHCLKGIISRFGLETILIYTALILKRKIVVYHHDIDNLIEFVLSLPTFLVHRNMWDAVYPWIDLNATEVSPLRHHGFYIAGCPHASVENHVDLYDILVNVPASEITVAPHAKEAMTMTKTHKDIALYMVQLSEKDKLTERDVMQEIARKTKDLLDHLRSLGTDADGKVKISLEQIKKKEYSPHLETFLYSLAKAENFAVIEDTSIRPCTD